MTTFEVAYGPRGWYLKHRFSSSSRTWSEPVRTRTTTTTTTSQLPFIKWDYTWYFSRPSRTRVLTTRRRSTTIVTPTTTTTTTTTTTVITTSTTGFTPTTTMTTTTSTEEMTTRSSTTLLPTTIHRTVTAQQRLLFTHKPWIYYNFTGFQSHSSSSRSFIKSTTQDAKLSVVIKTTPPLPTPWYSPAGPFDWWQWQWYTTRSLKSLSHSHSMSTTTTTQSTRTTTRSTPRTTTPIPISNKTNSHSKVILDRFVWPDQQLSSTSKIRSDDFEKEYQDWLEYLTTNGIQDVFTTTPMTTSTPIISREQYPPVNSLPTESNWRIVTVDTPPSKRQHQSNSLTSDRPAIVIQPNGMICLFK